MFEQSGSSELSDGELIAAVTDATRAEAAAAARRLALVAEVTARHCEDEDESSALRLIDGWALAKAEVSAACNLGPRAASAQMRIAMALRDRLPKTAEVFARGLVSAKVINAITWRTQLVCDEEALGLIDAGIAGTAHQYGALSETALIRAVDFWVHKFDPIAVIRSKAAANDRYIDFGDTDDPDGVVSFWGRMRATDAALSDTRLNDLAHGVCDGDPRTVAERRADALAAVLTGAETLTCLCGDPDCAGSGKDPRAGAVTIYVLTGQEPDTGHGAKPDDGPTPDGSGRQDPRTGPAVPGEPAATPPEAEPQPPSTPAAPTAPAASTRLGAGITLDGAIIPAHLLTELINTGAKVRPLNSATDLGSEPRYRPSAKLAAYVRMTAMTCCFPGCGKPAQRCDLDHVTPWPAGATHPGNLRPLCREHHLLKTVKVGWTPKAHPDGTTEWTSPSGQTYTTMPLGPVLFPHNTIDIPIPRTRHITLIGERGNLGDREPDIPRRQRTRQHDRQYRINAERTRNAAELAISPKSDAHHKLE
ncbi:HNH endonuclease signature motif containing protein [Mycolicibacterium neoaurum]|uniref:HNH endonuclease n=1 Tax=Mycolicibacterium neoaurum TaxID=1795 RepID=A0AAV2WPF9_MYCNE|nr:HNH endonuclease signature motif containing protein [Mycolicibacterium neoaurum]TLH62094.1 HNH endonuclease [Mycolicibacterium neoaurum]CDQ46027.1 HNH endonuclease [Mycolicibacterium neoaurum]